MRERETMKLHTYLNFRGNTEEAFRFYEKALGGKLSEVVRFKDMPMEGVDLPEGDQHKVMHVALELPDGERLMGSDSLESMGHTLEVGNNTSISVHPDSKAEADRIFEALSAGGDVAMPMADAPWGDYFGMFTDKFGVQWMINHAPPDEGPR